MNIMIINNLWREMKWPEKWYYGIIHISIKANNNNNKYLEVL